jgi:hypothetical protein
MVQYQITLYPEIPHHPLQNYRNFEICVALETHFKPLPPGLNN